MAIETSAGGGSVCTSGTAAPQLPIFNTRLRIPAHICHRDGCGAAAPLAVLCVGRGGVSGGVKNHAGIMKGVLEMGNSGSAVPKMRSSMVPGHSTSPYRADTAPKMAENGDMTVKKSVGGANFCTSGTAAPKLPISNTRLGIPAHICHRDGCGAAAPLAVLC